MMHTQKTVVLFRVLCGSGQTGGTPQEWVLGFYLTQSLLSFPTFALWIVLKRIFQARFHLDRPSPRASNFEKRVRNEPAPPRSDIGEAQI